MRKALSLLLTAVLASGLLNFSTVHAEQTVKRDFFLLNADDDWNEPDYEWSDDFSQVKATRTLKADESISETETVNTSSEVTKDPTCKEAGERTYTAVFENNAFEKQTAVVPIEKLEHTPGSPKTENSVPAGCTHDGSYDEVIYCTECGEEISRKAIPVGGYGHNWGEWVVTKEPTATEAGARTRTCKRDSSHIETETIPATGKVAGSNQNTGGGSSGKPSGAKKSPNTGDSSNSIIWFWVMITAAGTAGAALQLRKKFSQ